MVTDKNNKEVTLKNILDNLVGTDDMDQTKAVMDFSVYPVKDKALGDPAYYLVAANAIVTQISFMGAFTLVEVDFRNIGVELLKQVVAVVNQFHSDINTDNVVMISNITSLQRDASHIMVLSNPLVCVRGFSERGQGSTLLQLVYATENVGFSISDINYDEIDADIDREIREIESASISEEVLSADENGEGIESEMQQIFKPEFVPDFEEENVREKQSVRITGYARDKEKIGSPDTSRIKGVRQTEEEK